MYKMFSKHDMNLFNECWLALYFFLSNENTHMATVNMKAEFGCHWSGLESALKNSSGDSNVQPWLRTTDLGAYLRSS